MTVTLSIDAEMAMLKPHIEPVGGEVRIVDGEHVAVTGFCCECGSQFDIIVYDGIDPHSLEAMGGWKFDQRECPVCSGARFFRPGEQVRVDGFSKPAKIIGYDGTYSGVVRVLVYSAFDEQFIVSQYTERALLKMQAPTPVAPPLRSEIELLRQQLAERERELADAREEAARWKQQQIQTSRELQTLLQLTDLSGAAVPRIESKFVEVGLYGERVLDDYRAEGWRIAHEQFVVVADEPHYVARLEREIAPAPKRAETEAEIQTTQIVEQIRAVTLPEVTLPRGGFEHYLNNALTGVEARMNDAALTAAERRQARDDHEVLTAARDVYAQSYQPAPFTDIPGVRH